MLFDAKMFIFTLWYVSCRFDKHNSLMVVTVQLIGYWSQTNTSCETNLGIVLGKKKVQWEGWGLTQRIPNSLFL
jgi:hypothetical protein